MIKKNSLEALESETDFLSIQSIDKFWYSRITMTCSTNMSNVKTYLERPQTNVLCMNKRKLYEPILKSRKL